MFDRTVSSLSNKNSYAHTNCVSCKDPCVHYKGLIIIILVLQMACQCHNENYYIIVPSARSFNH